MDFKLSYDYNDLLDELKADIKEFGIKMNDSLYIVRDEPVQAYNHIYIPIIDYYFDADIEMIDEEVDVTTVEEVLKEMEEMNQLM